MEILPVTLRKPLAFYVRGQLKQVNNSVTFSGKTIGSEKFLNQIVVTLGTIIDRRPKGRPRKMES